MTHTRTRSKARITAAATRPRVVAPPPLPAAAIEELLRHPGPADVFHAAVIDVLARHSLSAALVRKPATIEQLRGTLFDPPAIRERLLRWCESVSEGKTFLSDDLRQVATCCVPLSLGERPAVLVAAYPTNGSDLASLRLLAAACGEWHARRFSRQLEQELAAATAIVELTERLGAATDLRAACYVLVDELHEFLGKTDSASPLQVAIALCGSPRSDATSETLPSIIAISGTAEFAADSEPVQQLTAVCHESLVRGSPTVWPPQSDSQRHSLLAHRKLAESRRSAAVISVPLTTTNGRTIGVLVAALEADEFSFAFLRTAAGPIATALVAVDRATASPWSRLRDWLSASIRQRGWRIALTTAVAIGALLCIPMPYRIACECTVEPVSRRVAVAPQEGLLETTLVEPGEFVRRDQPLAQLDGRELRWSLAGSEAERHQAAKERDRSLAAGDVTRSHLAQLEMERADVRLELLRFRAANLQVKSPLDGLVLSSTLERHSSAPVKLGQPLFEIAPLDPIRLELAIPADDFTHVQVGMPVEVALGDERIDCRVEKLRPRSEIRGGENVFVAEVQIANGKQSLRPGMTGFATVRGERHSIGWNWFHKAWARASLALRAFEI